MSELELSAVVFGLFAAALFSGLGLGWWWRGAKLRAECPHPEAVVSCIHGDARNHFAGVAWCRVCGAALQELPRVCSVTGKVHAQFEPPVRLQIVEG